MMNVAYDMMPTNIRSETSRAMPTSIGLEDAF